MSILLPISTRGAGMATVQMYQQLSTCEYFYEAMPHICVMYRAVLGLLELKLAYIQRDYNEGLKEQDRKMQYVAELDTDFDEASPCPNCISRLINTLGFIYHDSGSYVPAVHKRMYENDRYVPRTDNILISNLRETVVALSDPDTPLMYRRSFFKNNPIPGARFENDLLLNPDEIIPPDYTLTEKHLGDDLNQIGRQVGEMELHFEESSVSILYIDENGHDCMFYTNSQGNLAIPSHREGQDINDYYTKCLPTGNITNFWTKFPLPALCLDGGPVNLLGEIPNVKQFVTDFYDVRNMMKCKNPVLHHLDYNGIVRTLYPPYDEDAKSCVTPSPARDENGAVGQFTNSPFLL